MIENDTELARELAFGPIRDHLHEWSDMESCPDYKVIADFIEEALRKVREEENEACAKLASSNAVSAVGSYQIAFAIRDRMKTKGESDGYK